MLGIIAQNKDNKKITQKEDTKRGHKNRTQKEDTKRGHEKMTQKEYLVYDDAKVYEL